jgi:CPA2 family monovalent cation:H+ antiporter-2
VGSADFVVEILVVLCAAVAGAWVFEKLRLPAVAGLLLSGAAVGPGGLGLVEDADRVRVLAEFGVALLLFEIGLEMPIEALARGWRRAIASGALQVSLTIAAVAALAVQFGLPVETAIVMGMLVSLSSTAVAMRVLAQRDEVDTPHGQLSVGVLLFQDLCLVPFLLAIPILSGEVSRDPMTLALTIGQHLLALGALLAVARLVLPWGLEQVAKLRSPDLFSLFAFVLAVGSAVAAEAMGLTLAVGAFIAGLVVNASPYSHQIFAEMVPLRGVLLGIFFTSVGMLLDPRAAFEVWPGVLLFVGSVVVIKTSIIVVVVAGVVRQGLRIGLLTGIALAQTGEFSFVLAEAAAPSGLLDDSLGQIFIAGSICTLIATPFLIQTAPRLAWKIADLLDRRPSDPDQPESGAEDIREHVVIVGYGLAGKTLARILQASNIAYRIVEQNPTLYREAQTRNEPVLFGDATRASILDRVAVNRAKLVSIAINDAAATRRCIAAIRDVAPDVQIIVRARYVQDLDVLFADGATEVVAEEFESTIDLFNKVLRAFEIPPQTIAQFSDAMRMERYEFMRESTEIPLDPWLTEVLHEVSSEWIEVPWRSSLERSLGDLEIRAQSGASVLAVRRGDDTTPNPSADFALRAGDSLLVLASPPELRQLRELLARIE